MHATLVVLAAGLGSRFKGGIKQLEPLGPSGEIIMDYSIYDAKQAGFDKVVFIIRKDIKDAFDKMIGDRIKQHIAVDYVYQELDCLPDGFTCPSDRVKPWGHGHAVYCCKGVVNEPFVVINADDYYGKQGYKIMYEFLTKSMDDDDRYAMVSYELGKTLTEKGSVTRGVCKVDDNNMLTDIVEQKNLIKTPDGAAYTDADGNNAVAMDVKTPVSMNMWGFKKGLFEHLEKTVDACEVVADTMSTITLKNV